MEFKSELLDSSHDRTDFSCGKEALDHYIRHQVSQDVKRKLAVCFVVADKDGISNKVIGYFTLSNGGIPRDTVPEKYQKNFPKAYQSIPTTLIGRLARDQRAVGKRMGEFLLIDALYKCFNSSRTVASFAVIVDPIDDDARSFYAKYGFLTLPDSQRMFLSMKKVNELFRS
jgi:hypothetical protein